MPGLTLENRYLFQGEIYLKTALHIGGGDSAYSATDSAVVKLADKRPYIPGSSLKGVLRSTVERIVANLSDVNSCLMFEKSDSCLSGNERLNEEYKKLREEKRPETDLVEFLARHLCETCQLFGSKWLAAKICVNDAVVLEPWGNVVEARDGVGIDRDSQKAVDQCKFNYEAVPAGTRFDFLLQGENLTDRDLGLLSIGIRELMDGSVRLGGLSSRGLGQCQLELHSIRSIDFRDLDQVKLYLLDRKMSEVTDREEFLKAKIFGLIND